MPWVTYDPMGPMGPMGPGAPHAPHQPDPSRPPCGFCKGQEFGSPGDFWLDLPGLVYWASLRFYPGFTKLPTKTRDFNRPTDWNLGFEALNWTRTVWSEGDATGLNFSWDGAADGWTASRPKEWNCFPELRNGCKAKVIDPFVGFPPLSVYG